MIACKLCGVILPVPESYVGKIKYQKALQAMGEHLRSAHPIKPNMLKLPTVASPEAINAQAALQALLVNNDLIVADKDKQELATLQRELLITIFDSIGKATGLSFAVNILAGDSDDPGTEAKGKKSANEKTQDSASSKPN